MGVDDECNGKDNIIYYYFDNDCYYMHCRNGTKYS